MTSVRHASIILEQSPSHVVARCHGEARTVRPLGDAAAPHAGDPGPNQQESSPLDDVSTAANCQAMQELTDVLSSIAIAIADVEVARQQSLDELQQLAVELSAAIAGEIVFRAIDAEEHGVQGMVATALSQLGMDSPVSVTLHPDDLALLESVTQDADDIPQWHNDEVTLRPDSSLPRGHCRATNEFTTLLSEVGPRLEALRKHLWEGLDDAQVERRKTAQHDSLLKRFPDRRETA